MEQLQVAVRGGGATSFIGSFLDGPQHAVIVLRGDVDRAVVDRLAVHVEDLLATRTRVLAIDAAGVDRYHPSLLDLLGHTRRRLGHRRGLLRVHGLDPGLLPGPDPTPVPVPVAPLLRAVTPIAVPTGGATAGERP